MADPRHPEPTPSTPDNPFLRFDARVLDPTTAVRSPSGEIPSVTAYVGDTLLVTAADLDQASSLIEQIDAAARDGAGLRVVEAPIPRWNSEDGRYADRLGGILEAAQARLSLTVPVRVVALDEKSPAPAPDVWPLLQSLRARGVGLDVVGLDHLLYAAAGISGNPVSMKGVALILGDPVSMKGVASVNGNPVSMKGVSQAHLAYSVAGSGGRGPVSLVLPTPRAGKTDSRPQVLILDTGLGLHPWFTDVPATIGLTTPAGERIGLDPTDPVVAASDPEGVGGVADSMTGLLASHSGHGTFIAGLIRMTCPEAAITAVRVMDSDGVVPEDVLADALLKLSVSVRAGTAVDALVLSLGYYPETGEDLTYTAGLRQHLVELGRAGVAVFAAAGNDATTTPSFPAAFAADSTWPSDALRVTSVAALNPDRTVALFSNDGPWVVSEAPGANVVSTVPTRLDGSGGEGIETVDDHGRRRTTIDPDDYSSGFATWSGTSFAAPVAAGRFAKALSAAGLPKDLSQRAALIEGRPKL